jgi:hypothetical protein
MVAWARLVVDCRDAGLHRMVKLTDTLIAATAIEYGCPLSHRTTTTRRSAERTSRFVWSRSEIGLISCVHSTEWPRATLSEPRAEPLKLSFRGSASQRYRRFRCQRVTAARYTPFESLLVNANPLFAEAL